MRTRIVLLIATLTVAVAGAGSLVWTDAANAEPQIIWGSDMRHFSHVLLALVIALAALTGELMWGDGIIWGSLGEEEIIWGTLGESADYVVWGN